MEQFDPKKLDPAHQQMQVEEMANWLIAQCHAYSVKILGLPANGITREGLETVTVAAATLLGSLLIGARASLKHQAAHQIRLVAINHALRMAYGSDGEEYHLGDKEAT